MQNIGYLLLAIVAGVVIPVQTSLNAELDKFGRHPIITTMIVFLVGFVSCLIGLAIGRPQLPQFSSAMAVPVWAWIGGALAMVYVVLLVMVLPKIGVGMTTTLVLLGQMMAAMLLDHYGILGNPQHLFGWGRLLGLIFMICGVILIKRF